ncbi:MAG: translation initiation factor [Planctomycetaceae bacterium]|nr:translation initiation factor [Planctomycetaceae bacterium]
MSRLFSGTAWDRPPTCERCGALTAECACPPVAAEKVLTPPEKQTATLAVERRAKGKQVTVVRGLSADKNDLTALLTRLKSTCGAGGTIDGETLEIQGEHRDRIRTLLGQIGYRVKG